MISTKVLALLVGSSVYAEEQLDLANMPWMDKGETPEIRAQALVHAMNITEKASMLRGRGSDRPYSGHTAAIERVGIPQINVNDGPQGFRTDKKGGLST
jgi:beta-glucosidase